MAKRPSYARCMLWRDEGDLTDDEEVADLLEEYHVPGLDEFILSGYPHLEEVYWFGENVTPILRRRP
jgi:alkanesulfonate monooxygenase SsuD/methylene tetrahydromethanopterin reductase-like flavin-dependent oxidoreductase (luciferase family)